MTSLQLDSYISTSPKRNVIDYFAGDNEMSRPKSAAVKDIDIDIDDILGQKYRHRRPIDIGNIDPPLIVGPPSVCFS